MRFPLSKVVNSPFRNFTINPLSEDRVAALIESITTTGFWKNIVGRIDAKGKFEIIFGHHRVEALRRKNSSTTEFDFTVIKATDAEVLQRMSRDHDDRYNHDLTGVIELVKATVSALADGKISLTIPKDTNDQHIRVAPSFVPGRSVDSTEGRYTILSIAAFLGLTDKKGTTPQDKVRAAFKVLELCERKIWDDKTIRTFRRPDGTIPTEAVLNNARTREVQEALKKERRANAAQEAADKDALVQKELAEKKERLKKEKEAALDKQKEAEKREKKATTEIQEKKAADAAEEARIKAAEAQHRIDQLNARIQYKKDQKERQQQADKDREKQRAENERAAWVCDDIGKIDRIYQENTVCFGLCRSDVVNYSRKAHNKYHSTTDKEMKDIIAALRDLSGRVKLDADRLESALKERK